ncbi:MAG: dockerin type I repeat-containing protein [Bacillota bacterium]
MISVNTAFKHGDVNGDGLVNSTDNSLIGMYILGTVTRFPSEMGEYAADVDSNGKIDSIDYVLVRRYLLGIINRF